MGRGRVSSDPPGPAWPPGHSCSALSLGLVAFAGTVSWTSDVLAIFGGLNAALAWGLAALLIAYLAVYPAVFSLALTTAVARAGVPALAMAPILWVGTEWLRGTLFTGFPWVLLGYSQSDVVAPLQVASLVGIYGLSGLSPARGAALALLIAPTHVGLAQGWWRRAPDRVADGEQRVGCVARGARSTAAGPAVRVALVQGNVPQGQNGTPRTATKSCRATSR